MAEKIAEKFVIEVYRDKNAEDFTKLIADPDSRLETGSAAAVNAALAAAFLARAATITAKTVIGNERVDYVVRNAEIVRGYMVYLIDEDVKGHGALRRALKEGSARDIEATRHPAVSISAEIVNMMGQCLEMADELADLCPEDAKHYVAECAHTAMGAVRSSMVYIIDQSNKCTDETYKYVTRRENEMTLEQLTPVFERILSKTRI